MAALEGFKGIVVLVAGSGLLALVHRDVHGLATALIAHAHLNPASRYPKIFLDAAAQVDDPQLRHLAAGAAAYAAIRLVEGYGLYREQAWAEVLAALSAAIYVPFEVMAFIHHRTALSALLLALNVAVVALMTYRLSVRRNTAGSAL